MCCPTMLRRVNCVTFLQSTSTPHIQPCLKRFAASESKSFSLLGTMPSKTNLTSSSANYPQSPHLACDIPSPADWPRTVVLIRFYTHRLHAELKILNPPSVVKAAKLPAFAPHATSFAGTALRTSSDQLFDDLVYCCTEILP